MHVLITGGAGYLGSVLVHQLLVQGYSVTVLDNFMYGQQSLNYLCAFPKLKIVRGDARDPALFVPLLKQATAVVPLAAIVGAPACEQNKKEAESINLGAIRTLMNYLSSEQILVFPNTNSGYGTTGTEACTENTPQRPVSHYGKWKTIAEHEVLEHEKVTVLRFATLFGCSARMRLDLLVNDFVYRAIRDRFLVLFEGSFRRNFLHVRDAARAIEFSINHPDLMQGVFNAGRDDANMTKAELAAKVANAVGGVFVADAPLMADPDKRDYIVSNEKILATGWSPLFSLDDGIRELISCFQQPFVGNRNA